MTKKTMELIIATIGFLTELLGVIRIKFKGRKGNDNDKGNTEKK